MRRYLSLFGRKCAERLLQFQSHLIETEIAEIPNWQPQSLP